MRSGPIAVPHVRRTFDFGTRARQTLTIAWTSFRAIAKSRGVLVVLAAIAAFAVVFVLENMNSLGVPLLPRTAHVITWLAPPLDDPRTPWMIIPLLIVFCAGELVWREREAGLAEIADAAPVPEWVMFLGKFLGLSLILVAWMALLMAAGVLAQVSMGYHEFEIGVYVRALFGLQLPHYLLFAMLALAVQVAVNHRYVGHIVALLAFAFILMAPMFGIEHNLLVYAAGPGWSYSDMRGFGPSLGAWAWFKLYWAAWALLLAVAATLLWVRGREGGLGVRLRLARGRLTRPTAGVAALAVGLVLALGGFIFYNTNVLNEYRTAAELAERRADYERRYGQYERTLQPQLAGTRLHVEIYPKRRAVEIRGTYQLVNRSAVAIDSIHVAPVPGVETGAVTFDRPAARVVEDDELGHHIYALMSPLQRGDSLRLSFEVRSGPRGFGNHGVDPSVATNGTYFTNQALLPAIGYQRSRELSDAGDRRAHGLAPRPLLASLDAVEASQDLTGPERIDIEADDGTAFEAVVGTDADQIAVAPGALRRRWTEGGRRYFQYATSAPIGNEYTFHSANYAVREATWNPSAGSGQPVAIQVFHHPRHSANVDRMVLSVRASLDYYTEHFGPYPYSHIWLLEGPGNGVGMHAEPSHLLYSEGFTAWHPGDDPQALDLPFAVVAHEMAHQFQVPYAPVEGAPLLSESFAWYAALRVVERAQGPDQLRRLRSFMRKPYPFPPIRSGVPLLRARDPYAAYRKGPFALYALSEYIGGERMNGALRRLIEKHDSGAAPLATSLDLYRELQAVTPDSLRYLLHDLFAANTFWELETERATAEQTAADTWRVTLDVRARKLVVDSAGVETEVPMHDWVEVGVFAPVERGDELGEPLYVRMHRMRSGEQTITVTVPRRPVLAGVDPYHLLDLIELENDDNVEAVETEADGAQRQQQGDGHAAAGPCARRKPGLAGLDERTGGRGYDPRRA